MRKNKPNKVLFIICLIIFSLSTFGCEITFHPNVNLYETPYGTVCMQDNQYETTFLLSVAGEKLYYLKSIHKFDLQKKLISINISENKSKLYILIGKERWEQISNPTELFVFDLINPQDNVYDYSCLIKHALTPLYKETTKIITDVTISNNSITYTERSGKETTILFDTLQPKI